ncbi:MAG: ClpP family protease [Gemmataceae bacterium]
MMFNTNASPRNPYELMNQRRGEYEREKSLYQLLIENRIVFLGASPELTADPRITDFTANFAIQKLLWLQYQNRNQEIHMYINSPGGSVSATLALYDTMQYLECPVSTYCMGFAASGAAVLLTAGTKGRRYALPNSKVMIHQPWGPVGGQISDIEIQASEMLKERERLNEILVKHTGQDMAIIEKETDRDRFFNAGEAKEFGLVDEVLTKITDEKK